MRFASFVFIAALAACGQPAATSAPEAPTTPTATEAAPLTPAMLVGRWGDNGDCTKDVVFNADGTFTSYAGGSGTWSLDGDRVTMTGANGPFEVRVELINNDTLMIGNADGSFGVSQRCP